MEEYQFEKLVLETKRNLPLGEFELEPKSCSHVGRTIAKAINDNNSIAIYGDYDVDGIATSTLLQEFILDVAEIINKKPKVDITISTRYTSGYGMSADKVKSLAKDYDLIIGVDHGVNAEFLDSFDNFQNRMVVFDHHKSNNNDYNFIINPAIDGVKEISSGIVVKKFIDYFIDKTKLKIDANKYSDLEALTIIPDMAELNDYSRKRLEEGLKKINEKQRFCFKSYVGKINHKDLSFGVISKINAVGRMKDDVDFVVNWIREKKDYIGWKNTTMFIEKINEEKNKLVNIYFKKFIEQWENNKGNKNSLALYVSDDIPIGLNGLIAQRMFQHTNQETIVMSLHNDKYRGFGRGHDIFNTLSKISEAINQKNEKKIEYGGHEAAIGIKFNKDVLEDFNFHCIHSETSSQKEVEILGKLDTEKLVNFSRMLSDLTEGIPLNRKFYFSLEDYELTDMKRYKNNHASVQITNGEKTIGCFVNLDLIKEEHLRNGKPLKVSVDELFSDNYSHEFAIEAQLEYGFDTRVNILNEQEIISRCVE